MKVRILKVSQSCDPLTAGVRVDFLSAKYGDFVIVESGQDLRERIKQRIAELEELDKATAESLPLILELKVMEGMELDIGD